MRYGFIAMVMALGGCGSLEAYDNARSFDEAFWYIKKGSNEMTKAAVGKNPYDFDPAYRMVYCARDGIQYWSTEATCLAEKGEPKT